MSNVICVITESILKSVAFEMKGVDFIISFSNGRCLEVMHDMGENLSWSQTKILNLAVSYARSQLAS